MRKQNFITMEETKAYAIIEWLENHDFELVDEDENGKKEIYVYSNPSTRRVR